MSEFDDNTDEALAAFEAALDGEDVEIEGTDDDALARQVDMDGFEDEKTDEATDTEDPAKEPTREPEDTLPIGGTLDPEVQAYLDGIREELTGRIDQVQNDARAASGRTRKLEGQVSEVSQQVEEQSEKTRDWVKNMMEGSEAFGAMKQDWPDHAETIETLGNAMADQIDEQISATKAEMQGAVSVEVETEVMRRTVDEIKKYHPNALEVANSDDFREWVFSTEEESALTPNSQERENWTTLNAEQDPRAEKYYNALLDKYPDWAEDRGRLYGDSSAHSSISLLDKYRDREVTGPDPKEQERQRRQEEKRQQLLDNAPPTRGRGGGAPLVDLESDAERAFNEGLGEA